MKRLASVAAFCLLLVGPASLADMVLLQDYEGGGLFGSVNPANHDTDNSGNTNDAYDAGTYMTVDWATTWSGGNSSGAETNLNAYDTYQFDIMVPVGQPVEAGSSFYLQFNCTATNEWSYWEYYVGQNNIPADGTWYRVQFPMGDMWGGSGPNEDDPTDFSEIQGITIGMTYDPPPGSTYQFKSAHLDNVGLTDDGVTGLTITAIPEPGALGLIAAALGLLALRRSSRR